MPESPAPPDSLIDDAPEPPPAARERITERTQHGGSRRAAATIERGAKTVEIKGLNLFYGSFQAVQDVDMRIEPNKVTALIGSSGCGKTTFLRSINRMHELTPGASAEGQVLIDGQDIYGRGVYAVQVRRLVGAGFPAADPFPARALPGNRPAGLAPNRRH